MQTDTASRAIALFGTEQPSVVGQILTAGPISVEFDAGQLRYVRVGDVEVLGLRWAHHAIELRQRLGIQLQETQLADKLTVEETLRLFRSFYHRRSAASVSSGTATAFPSRITRCVAGKGRRSPSTRPSKGEETGASSSGPLPSRARTS